MVRSILSAFLLLASGMPMLAQEQSVYDEPGRTLYSREIYGGPLVHGDGWGGTFQYGKYLTARHRRVFALDVVTMKHPKEIKSFNPNYQDARGYFYGKLNTLFIIRPTIGGKHRITEKLRKSGVEVNWCWGVGPSLGFLKPVYLQILSNEPAFQTITTERYDPARHFANNIYSRASWFTGLGETQIYPGGFGRAALNFEYAGDNTGIRALEVGASLDAYAEELPIMADLEGIGSNKQFYLEFYLALHFGSKKIR